MGMVLFFVGAWWLWGEIVLTWVRVLFAWRRGTELSSVVKKMRQVLNNVTFGIIS